MKQRISSQAFFCWSAILQAKLSRRLGRRIAPVSVEEVEKLGARQREFGLGLEPLSRPGQGLDPDFVSAWLKHEFSLLGVQWPAQARVSPSLSGAESWLKSAGLIPEEYSWIDWKNRFGLAPGEDIKLPWELARLQHLPALALHAFRQREDAPLVERIAREIQAQLADFVLQNPLSEGANWLCAMDVSIRICNVLVAAEILQQAGWRLPAPASRLLAKMALEHGRYIYRNLEWYREGRGNHYLADLVGLAFCSLWLPASRESSRWLAFSALELVKETRRQFQADGSNFEGSVFYHRLSLELVAFGWAALHAARRKHGFSVDGLEDLPHLLARGARFLADLTDQRGNGVQIGDNDSGRLFKLEPRWIEIGGQRVENSLYTADTIALGALLRDGSPESADAALLLALAGAGSFRAPVELKTISPASRVNRENSALIPPSAAAYEFRLPALADPESAQWGSYEDFGVYFWKGKTVEAWLRCGPPSGDGHHGHAHFDQLHLEIRNAGEPVTFDPGSFAYTGDLSARNHFRGAAAHFIPRLLEQEALARQDVDAFRYPGLPTGHCLTFSRDEFLGYYELGGKKVFRRVQFLPGAVKVWDWADGAFTPAERRQKWISWGYGFRLPWPWREE